MMETVGVSQVQNFCSRKDSNIQCYLKYKYIWVKTDQYKIMSEVEDLLWMSFHVVIPM